MKTHNPHILLALAILLCAVLWCRADLTPRLVTASKSSGKTMAIATAITNLHLPHPPAAIPQTMVVLVWQPNQDGTNVATEIISSEDISIPREKWKVKFLGRTNTATFAITNAHEFYSGASVLQ